MGEVMMMCVLRLAGAALVVAVLMALPTAANADGSKLLRTGPYIGLIGGYDVAEMQTEGFTLADGKLLAGVYGGVNFRLAPDLLAGIEADYLLTNVKGSQTVDEVSVTASSTYLASIRARLGMPIGPALPFVTAGAAFTNHRFKMVDGESVDVAKDNLVVGVVFGAGVDLQLSNTVIARLDVMHYMFPDEGFGLFKSEDQQTVGRVGVSFMLN